jgi:mono/diheme cytochrome c family protein
LAAVGIGACARGSTSTRPPIHLNPNMDHQPKVRAQAESDFFADGAAMRTPVAGTVARGDLAVARSFVTGFASPGVYLAEGPPSGPGVLERGAERYGIYCGPCHGESGDGRSMLRQRSGVNTADLLEERIRRMPDGQIFDVITNGFGLMTGYAYQIPPEDRWAVIAHLRRLQAEQPVAAGATGTTAAEGAP